MTLWPLGEQCVDAWALELREKVAIARALSAKVMRLLRQLTDEATTVARHKKPGAGASSCTYNPSRAASLADNIAHNQPEYAWQLQRNPRPL